MDQASKLHLMAFGQLLPDGILRRKTPKKVINSQGFSRGVGGFSIMHQAIYQLITKLQIFFNKLVSLGGLFYF